MNSEPLGGQVPQKSLQWDDGGSCVGPSSVELGFPGGLDVPMSQGPSRLHERKLGRAK